MESSCEAGFIYRNVKLIVVSLCEQSLHLLQTDKQIFISIE